MSYISNQSSTRLLHQKHINENRQDIMQKTLLSSKQLSRILNKSKGTLARWRLEGCGPKFIKIGRDVMYDLAEINSWIEKNTFSSTSQFTN